MVPDPPLERAPSWIGSGFLAAGLGSWCLLDRAMRLIHLPIAAALFTVAIPARGTDPWAGEPVPAASKREGDDTPKGRPTIKLDRLDFPEDVRNWRYFKKHLRDTLRRETRRAIWGAGRGSTITYRFAVTDLTITEDHGVLRVKCTAVGQLPKGKTAKGSLSFGGDARRRNAVVNEVLQIVARGVVTRLAELERVRRGNLRRSRIRRPILVQ